MDQEDIKNNFFQTKEENINYLKKNYNSFIDELPDYENTHETNKIIFWCWLQGKANAPKLALANLNSLKQICKEFKIIIIDEFNIGEYVNIPSYIIKKYKKKLFSKTHFSDLIRLELLIKFGGTWIDSSVLITNYDERFFNKDLFFFGEKNFAGCISSSWFITSEKKSPILRTTLDLLYEYWRKNDYLYNYFLFHLFFTISSNKYQKDYKKVLFMSNIPPHQLQGILDQKYNEDIYKMILNKTSLHKLTIHKSNYKDNSFYNHIIDLYYSKKNSIF